MRGDYIFLSFGRNGSAIFFLVAKKLVLVFEIHVVGMHIFSSASLLSTIFLICKMESNWRFEFHMIWFCGKKILYLLELAKMVFENPI